ncbi:lytic transglycosylase domain-containing protein [Kluyvera sichuanensis]|uniref:lytic transglycosylase domain-containing protein n=1 Tax=Kluyvera sichuanensis TaxID=2725494 RepID=UPI0039F72617
MDLPPVIDQCGPDVATEVIHRIVSVESSFNPYAIGVVGGRLQRQPKTKDEAVVTAKFLADNGWNFSMGLAQVNRYNLAKYGLNYHSVFEPCANLRAAASIYQECLTRALKTSDYNDARLKAFSCYYSGNFHRGFMADAGGKSSYVQRIANVDIGQTVTAPIMPIPVISNTKRPAAQRVDNPKQRLSGAHTKSEGRIQKINNSPRSYNGGIKQLRGD